MNVDSFNSYYAQELCDSIGCPNFRGWQCYRNNYLPFFDSSFLFLGCKRAHISIVRYSQGAITCYEKEQNCIGLSFEFTGCAMAQFSYADKTYILHISLHGPRHVYDMRNQWNIFLDKIATKSLGRKFHDFKLFKPFDQTALVLLRNHGLNYDCCGIIDINGDCYSALVYKPDCSIFKMWRRNDAKIANGNLTATNLNTLKL